MTCAHVVDVTFKKLSGVESVEVSLNKGLAIIKLKPGNTVSVPQLWRLLHDKGYTPKATRVTARGALAGAPGRLALQISGTSDTLQITADPKSAELVKQLGRNVTVHGVMLPGKDLKAPVPLQIE